jgi:hypothetical protein
MKFKQILSALLLLAGIGCTLVGQTASAVKCGTGYDAVDLQPGQICCGGRAVKLQAGEVCCGDVVTNLQTGQSCCNGVVTSMITCDQSDSSGDGIWKILLLAINILTAGVGVVALGGIVYASILYTTAGGGTEQTKKAMEMIANVVIGLIAYVLMYAFLNYIVPGGLFAS